MDKQTFDLGAVTAYADAVAGGYTGTRDEFQKLLGNLLSSAKDTGGDGAVGAVVDIAQTYFDKAYSQYDQLIYRSTHGLFTDLTDTDEKTGETYESIVCSQFVQACIGGIAYQNSRYVSGYESENRPYWWGFETDGTGKYFGKDDTKGTVEDYYQYAPDYMRASEQYNYFDKKGVLHKFDTESDTVQLQPGDICFYLYSTFDSSYKGTVKDYISHVGICLRADSIRHTIMHSNSGKTRLLDGKEAGVMVDEWEYKKYPPTAYVHLADIIPRTLQHNSTLILAKELYAAGTTGEDNEAIDELTFSLPLARGFYTINLETASDCDSYFAIHYDRTPMGEVNNKKTVDVRYYVESKNGMTSVVIYAELPIYQIDICVHANRSYKLGSCYVYKGYHGASNE